MLYTLFAMTLLCPAGAIIAARFGYRFILISVPAFAIATAALSVVAFGLDIGLKYTLEDETAQVFMAIMSPMSFVNGVVCMYNCPRLLVAASTFLSAGCAFFFMMKHAKPLALKIVAIALSALLILPTAFLGLLALIFGNFGKDTVVQSVDSPNGKYCAQVIASSQGALGGDTFVEVYRNQKIDLFLFKIEKKPQRVYYGEWYEFETMKIHWIDDDHIAVNGRTYEIE